MTLPPASVTAGHKSYVTYSLPGVHVNEVSVTLFESPALLGASGTTGFRTWEASLLLGAFFCSTSGQGYVKGKSLLELGAGTGLLAILCAKHLGAKSVLATDGARNVLEDLKTNIELNDLESSPLLKVKSLKWGHSLIGAGPVLFGEDSDFELAFGSDIVSKPYRKAV